MKCQYCNSDIPDEALFCPECGQKQEKREEKCIYEEHENLIREDAEHYYEEEDYHDDEPIRYCKKQVYKKRDRKTVFLIIILVILVVLMLAILFKVAVYDVYLGADAIRGRVESILDSESIFSYEQNRFIEPVEDDVYTENRGTEQYVQPVTVTPTATPTPIPTPTLVSAGQIVFYSEETPVGSQYILEKSNREILTQTDISGLSLREVNYAKNEIYARHGRLFNSRELQNYFNSKSWYYGTISPDAFNESVFSEVEKKNIEILKEREFSMSSNGYQLDVN